jgi:hypothetical protein
MVSIIDRHAGFYNFVNSVEKSSLKRDGPVFFFCGAVRVAGNAARETTTIPGDGDGLSPPGKKSAAGAERVAVIAFNDKNQSHEKY